MPEPTAAAVIPTMRYRAAPAAVEWLCRAFGFQRHLVVPGPDGAIAHAGLSFGAGMIMLGSYGSGQLDQLMAVPDDAVGRCTQSVHVVVPDADARHERAAGAGAEIIMPPWSFGSYDPRA